MKMKIENNDFLRIVFLSIILIVFTNTCFSLELAIDGKAAAEIILPVNPSETEVFAAEELEKYFNKITSAEYTIISEEKSKGESKIYIGKCKASKKFRCLLNSNEPDCFTVKSKKNNLYLFGVTERATLYAVYDFLEDDLGCRWLAPGPQWEDIVEQKSITLDEFERVESPDMRYRFQRFTAAAKPGTPKDYLLDWAVKQKINIGFGWPSEAEPEQITKRGGLLGWMHPHPLTYLFDCKKAFKEHPEWFAMLNGRRALRRNKNFVNFCTTNEELISKVVESIRSTFDKHPTIEFLPLGPGDGIWFCGCDKCKSLDVEGKIWPDHQQNKRQVLTDRWLIFMNAVAAELKKTHPTKKLYTLAYHQTFAAPELENKPLDNVMIQVVNCRPNYLCFLHKVTRKDCPKNAKFCAGLEEWSKITPSGLMVYQYAPHSQFCCMPYPAVNKFTADIKYMFKNNVIGHETQTSPDALGFYTPALLACAKTTWDTNTDPDELIEDYCKRAYDESAEPMIELMHLFEEGLENGSHSSFGIWPGFNDELLIKARKLLNKAKSLAKSDIVNYRLESAEVHMAYSEKAFKAWKQINEAIEKNDEHLKDEALASINEAIQTTKKAHEADPLKINFCVGDYIYQKFELVWRMRNNPEVRD